MIKDTDSNLALMIGGFLVPVAFWVLTDGAFPWWVYALSVPAGAAAVYNGIRDGKARESIIERNEREIEREDRR